MADTVEKYVPRENPYMQYDTWFCGMCTLSLGPTVKRGEKVPRPVCTSCVSADTEPLGFQLDRADERIAALENRVQKLRRRRRRDKARITALNTELLAYSRSDADVVAHCRAVAKELADCAGWVASEDAWARAHEHESPRIRHFWECAVRICELRGDCVESALAEIEESGN